MAFTYEKLLSSPTKVGTVKVPKNKPSSVSVKINRDQIKNMDGGGYVFRVDPTVQVERFLILGSDAGSYYASGRELTLANAKVIVDSLDNNPWETLKLIHKISREGLAIKNEPAILALAIAVSHKNPEVRNAAYELIPEVCRIGTHLFQFCSYIKSLKLRGWGSGLRNAIARWYLNQDVNNLAYGVTKYNSRSFGKTESDTKNTWSHKNVLELCRPRTSEVEKNALFRYITEGNSLDAVKASRTVIRKIKDKRGNIIDTRKDEYSGFDTYPALLDALEEVKNTSSESKVATLIRKHNLAREHIPTIMLNSKTVWRALLEKMPITALVRNLAKMTSMGMFVDDMSDDTITTIKHLINEDKIKSSRIHPLSIYLAMSQYNAGHGDKGSLTWTPNKKIMEALEKAFYSSFSFIKPSNKRFSVNLDVSASMNYTISGMNITHMDAESVIAMALYKSEPFVHVGMFSTNYSVADMSGIKTLRDMNRVVRSQSFQSTNVGIPIKYALDKKQNIDCFVIITDNDVNTGEHPAELMKEYRKKSGIHNSKLLVLSTIAHGYSVADPKDPNMLDIAGFSSDVPTVMSWFASQE